jgi:4a-hydroxytetrahydrobiopterin dehydratase
MEPQTIERLAASHCSACESAPNRFTSDEVREQLGALAGWRLSHDGQRIRRDWEVKDFLAGMDFLQHVAELAESEGHHPDLHLEEYRHVWIELWTHSVGGLAENDFILAAKIDRLPVQTRKAAGGAKP